MAKSANIRVNLQGEEIELGGGNVNTVDLVPADPITKDVPLTAVITDYSTFDPQDHKGQYCIIQDDSGVYNQSVVYPETSPAINVASFSGVASNYTATWTATHDCFVGVDFSTGSDSNFGMIININGFGVANNNNQQRAQRWGMWFIKTGSVISATCNSPTIVPTGCYIFTREVARSYIDPTGITQARPISYSTTEQDTGQKWIGEKPIYQKTFVHLSHPALTAQERTPIGTVANLIPGATIIITVQAVGDAGMIYYYYGISGNNVTVLSPNDAGPQQLTTTLWYVK